MRLREVGFITNDNFKRALIHVLHELHVKFTLAAHAVFVLHPLGNRVIAAQIDFPSADAPQEHLHKALGIAVVGLGKFRAAQLRFKHGDKAVFALDRNFERARCAVQIRLCPHAERNEVRIERRPVFDRIFNAQILHIQALTAAFCLPPPRHRSA